MGLFQVVLIKSHVVSATRRVVNKPVLMLGASHT